MKEENFRKILQIGGRQIFFQVYYVNRKQPKPSKPV